MSPKKPSASGLHSVWTFERQLSPVGEIRMGEHSMRMRAIDDTVYSPLESLAFAAARTSTVRFGIERLAGLTGR